MCVWQLGDVPGDWRKVSVTCVFKKSKKEDPGSPMAFSVCVPDFTATPQCWSSLVLIHRLDVFKAQTYCCCHLFRLVFQNTFQLHWSFISF